MTVAAILLAGGSGHRFEGGTHKLLARWGSSTVLDAAIRNVASAKVDELIVVTGAEADAIGDATRASFDAVAPSSPSAPALTIVHNAAWERGQASSLHVGFDAARAAGHETAVVGLADQPGVPVDVWNAVLDSDPDDALVVFASYDEGLRPPVRLAASVWDCVASEGDEGARSLLRTHPDWVTQVEVRGDPRDVDTVADLLTDADRAYVEECLGRPPRCAYLVAARRADSRPTVIENPPFLDDGTPMPTQFWLVDPDLNRRIGTLEAAGGVNDVEALIGLGVLAEVHDRYRSYRESLIGPDHDGPRPSGGVGGTRVGVKCLHTHYAWFLAGGADPVGAWVDAQLAGAGQTEPDEQAGQP